MYAVNDADKKYQKEFGYRFSSKSKKMVAEKMVNEFEFEFKQGNFSEYKPKYKSKNILEKIVH
jgi:hypothetical protein